MLCETHLYKSIFIVYEKVGEVVLLKVLWLDVYVRVGSIRRAFGIVINGDINNGN